MFPTVRSSSALPESRLASLYNGEGFGGDNSMRARVIRELIDEIRALRRELARHSATDLPPSQE